VVERKSPLAEEASTDELGEGEALHEVENQSRPIKEKEGRSYSSSREDKPVERNGSRGMDGTLCPGGCVLTLLSSGWIEKRVPRGSHLVL